MRKFGNTKKKNKNKERTKNGLIDCLVLIQL